MANLGTKASVDKLRFIPILLSSRVEIFAQIMAKLTYEV